MVVPNGTATAFLCNNIAVTHNFFFANLSSRYAVKLIATSIVNGSRKTITRYLPYGRYDKFNEYQGLRPATICWLQIRRNGAMLRVTYYCWYCRMCNLSVFTFHLSVHLICPSRRSLPEVFTFQLSPFTFHLSPLTFNPFWHYVYINSASFTIFQ